MIIFLLALKISFFLFVCLFSSSSSIFSLLPRWHVHDESQSGNTFLMARLLGGATFKILNSVIIIHLAL